MIGLEDRQALARDIHVAHVAGARLKPACAMAGIELRTFQRWQAIDGLVAAIADRRPFARPLGHALTLGRAGARAGRRQRTAFCGGAAGAHCADAGR
jgi:putative transposase